jgi:hypothetical protein
MSPLAILAHSLLQTFLPGGVSGGERQSDRGFRSLAAFDGGSLYSVTERKGSRRWGVLNRIYYSRWIITGQCYTKNGDAK